MAGTIDYDRLVLITAAQRNGVIISHLTAALLRCFAVDFWADHEGVHVTTPHHVGRRVPEPWSIWPP